MSLNFLVRGKVDQLPQSQTDTEHKALPAIAAPPAPPRAGQRDRGQAAGGEQKMTDDLQAIANLIGQLTDDAPVPPAHQASTVIEPEAEAPVKLAPEKFAPEKFAVESSAREDSLFDEYQATLARLEASKNSGEGLLAQIETFSTTLERQAAELSMTRVSMSKLATDNSRLVNENDRLRAMLRSLLEAIDADARRNNESIAAAERRLRDLSRQPGERDRQKQGSTRGLVAEG
jgi:regulator of replication initiation timing